MKKLDQKKQARLDALMDANNERGLTPAERAEFVALADEGHRLTVENAEDLIAARARGVDIARLLSPES